MRISETLEESYKILERAGICSYRLDSQLLLAESLKSSREYVIGYPEKELSSESHQIFSSLISRREKREPVSQILGKREFWGMEFKVNRHVLDPRPDSEILIETAIKLFKNRDKKLKILDVGTGSGCLLFSLLKEFPNAHGVGIDISFEALSVAKDNSVNLGLANRTKLVLTSLTEGIKGKFDLVISNPPYIKSGEIDYLEPEIRYYEPICALSGGIDGLYFYKQLSLNIPYILKSDGYVIFEIGKGQLNQVSEMLKSNNFCEINYARDYKNIERCVVAKLT